MRQPQVSSRNPAALASSHDIARTALPADNSAARRLVAVESEMPSRQNRPCQTPPPNVVMNTLLSSNGSGATRYPHLKSYPEIRFHVVPRSTERHAEDSNPDAYSTSGRFGSV